MHNELNKSLSRHPMCWCPNVLLKCSPLFFTFTCSLVLFSLRVVTYVLSSISIYDLIADKALHYRCASLSSVTSDDARLDAWAVMVTVRSWWRDKSLPACRHALPSVFSLFSLSSSMVFSFLVFSWGGGGVFSGPTQMGTELHPRTSWRRVCGTTNVLNADVPWHRH